MMAYEKYLIRFAFKIVMGIACYFLAKKRNKNEKLAFVLGFILGIFALAYYLFVAARRSTSLQEDYVKCKECEEIFVSSKKFCPNCKKKVTLLSTKKVR